MNMPIQHNLAAMNASGQYNVTSGKRAKSTEKLSSGYRVNRAADDAAGLAISEKMRRQINGLTQASRNIQDGISFDQSADGYLNEVHSILQRINQLAVQSANGTNEETDRAYLDQEVQALKKETKKIFREADFNEIKIWEMPYMPEPELIPNKEPDIQVFNSGVDANGNPLWGGVEINHVRHTWEELGVKFKEDGKTFDGDQWIPSQEGELDYTGERIVLRVKDGEQPPLIARNYKWQADENGISVNNVKPVIPWSEVKDEDGNGIAELVEYKDYSFTFRNMKIGFTPAKGDTTMDDVIKGISGDTLPTFYTFDLAVSTEDPIAATRQAVQTTGKRQYVNNANQHIIDNDYTVKADETGVTLWEEDGKDHRFMRWGHTEKDFNATKEGQQFPITDWGTTRVEWTNGDVSDDGYAGLNSRMITFDDGINYVYKDTVGGAQYKLPVEFSFSLEDETSIDAAIAALDGATFSKEFYAPGDHYSGDVEILSDALSGDFYKQRAYGRDFDRSNATLNGNITKTTTVLSEETTGELIIGDSYGSSTRKSENPVEVYARTDDGKYCKLNRYDSTKTETWRTQETLSKEIKCEYTGDFAGFDMQKQNGEGTVKRTNTYNNIMVTDTSVYRYTGDDGAPVIVDTPPEGAVTIEDFDFSKIGEDINKVRSNRTLSGSVYENDDDVVTIKTSKGEAMTVKFANSYDDGTTKQAKVQWNATDLAYREFRLKPNYNDLSKPVYNASSKANFRDFHINVPERDLWIQAGVEAGSGIMERWEPLNNAVIGISSANVRTQEDAALAIYDAKKAMAKISEQRSDFGAYQNRLEHAYNIDQNTAENTQYAESQIRDTNMAEEMVRFSNLGILEQAGSSMLTQANQSRQNILSLLQG